MGRFWLTVWVSEVGIGAVLESKELALAAVVGRSWYLLCYAGGGGSA